MLVNGWLCKIVTIICNHNIFLPAMSLLFWPSGHLKSRAGFLGTAVPKRGVGCPHFLSSPRRRREKELLRRSPVLALPYNCKNHRRKRQSLTSTHKPGVQGAKPLAGGAGVSPESSSFLCSPPKATSYEWISNRAPGCIKGLICVNIHG